MIHFQDVSVAWEEKTLISDVSLLIPHGKKGVIVGPSGCGKSTLLMAVMGAIPSQKSQLVEGSEIPRR